MSDRLQQLSLFVRAVDAGSFSRAGQDFNLSQPSVSRSVSELEARLGVRLLLRTTRKLTLTEAGAAYLEHARGVLEAIEEAEGAARGADSLGGTLRVALPVAFGMREVVPLLAPFLDRHPGLKIDLLMADRFDDLVAEGVDMAIRVGAQPDASFVTRRLAQARRLVVAAPDYLKRRGVPMAPADLLQHDCLRGPGETSAVGWQFRRGDTSLSVAVAGRLGVSSAGGLLAAAVAGLGVSVMSMWMCRTEIDDGRLQPLLTDYELEPVSAYLVFPGGRHASPKARAFGDYLDAALRNASANGVPISVERPVHRPAI